MTPRARPWRCRAWQHGIAIAGRGREESVSRATSGHRNEERRNADVDPAPPRAGRLPLRPCGRLTQAANAGAAARRTAAGASPSFARTEPSRLLKSASF
ncbi:hypothetical protein BURPS1106B_A1946 [Burkholderia pseudomallei 1106b]|uniref:Uncharacterized protein n=1 Tax=Burkholderia pseudomallei (strain 1106a) TaxID=357348 RepID=A3NXA5_BURP0|nr:hypothetical protein BURPS1106A_2725 [Burkholderia pseudomallei 1106a]EES27115.1 hypothetical protein BURPS1106B_A1946 [Burkholderia pseudomallei 1106b]